MQLFFLFFSLIAFSQSNFEKGEKLFVQKKYNEAKQLFQDYLKSHPNHSKTIEYLGDIAGYQKKWDEAIDNYKKLKTSFPKIANYWYKYGGALGMKAKESNKFKALGMIDEVEESFLTAAKLDSKHIETRWALVMLYVELPAIIGGSEKKSQKYADELMILSKVDGYLAKGYIDIYFKRYTKAEINYKKAHEIGNSKTTFEKLYDLYLNKLKDKAKANKLKLEFENK
ncbi:MAG TPA: tetratricopeptide repeat protein [Flavobacterium sp.]|uniref:tetratricopeptide repeat protein n=1 Tax=Flavobacterium sp. TaxID=239 RepID=UPI002B4B081F|nr:tetratricopeptide repeat protein [Flavobacterium sp.]HLO73839.1 tetratricopeptide repeat protein [Flavobacterium sp.]